MAVEGRFNRRHQIRTPTSGDVVFQQRRIFGDGNFSVADGDLQGWLTTAS